MELGDENSLDENDIAELAEVFKILASIDAREKERIAGETALLIKDDTATPALEEVHPL